MPSSTPSEAASRVFNAFFSAFFSAFLSGVRRPQRPPSPAANCRRRSVFRAKKTMKVEEAPSLQCVHITNAFFTVPYSDHSDSIKRQRLVELR